MAITDYIPNIFGQAAPSYIQGLLGAEETKNLQNRANVQGLLGAGLALAQGMGRTGPRRSAAENVLGALAGGFGAAGGAYDQGIKNYVTQQQIAQTQLAQQKALIERQQYMAQQGAVENLLKSPEIANDPLKVAYIRANPNEALKLYSELLPLQRAGQPTLAVPQTQPASAAMPAQLGGQTQPAATQPAPVMDGQEKPLPPVESVAKPSLYNQRIAEKQGIENTIRIYSDPQFAGNERATKIVDQSLKRLEAINKEITKSSVSDLSGDLQSLKKSAPPQFHGQIDNLMNIAATGEITPDQLAQRSADISKQISDFNKEEKTYERTLNDFTKEAVRVGRQVVPGKDPKDYNDADYAAINAEIQRQAIQRRPVTTINLSDPARKAQALSENSTKYIGNKNVSESFEVATRFNNFVQAYNNPQAGGVSDAALIYNVAKMLDPGGAVQQGDIQTIAGQATIPDRLKGIHRQFVNTRSLSDEQRENLNAIAYSIMNVKRKALQPVIKQYRNYATALQSPDVTADIQDPFENVDLPKERIVTINGKRTKVRLGEDPNGVKGYYYTAPNGKTYPYQD
jgi:hypothetical protein